MFGSRDRACVVLAFATLVVAGCSGDDDSAATTVAVETPPTVPSTTETQASTAPSTTHPATTTEATVTSTSSSAPPTTAQPPPSTDATTMPETTLPDGVPPRVTFPNDPDLQAVVDALYEYVDALRAASAEPTDSLRVTRLMDTVTEPLMPRIDEFISGLVDSGQAYVLNDELPTRTEVMPPSVEIVGDLAAVDVCAIDGDVRVELGGNPDGTDRVVDDTVVSASLTYSLTFVDGRWVVSNLDRFARWEDQVGCG
jgi:hypothetical protein